MSHQQLMSLLLELAMDLHWSWSHASDKIWKQLDPVLWELTHNPLVVLQTVSQAQINMVLQDPIAMDVIKELAEAKEESAVAPAWFQHYHPENPIRCIAYFSMEFMLSEALPIYSGGLGNVAGDHLKTASDLGLPVVGIGLLYQQGYSRQVIRQDGRQQYVHPFNDPGQLPITPLRDANGEWLRIEIQLPGYSVWLRTWKAQVGRVSLFLLDSNDAANFPLHRGITAELYGGDATTRLLQELILGIGGWRLLTTLGMKPNVCHLNEGHTAFVIAEQTLNQMKEAGQSFDDALAIIRSGNLFTTHTAVGAGYDLFSPELIDQYLGHYIQEQLKVSIDHFLALGRLNPLNAKEKFNTAYFAIRGSGYVNGVSKLHGQISRELFAPLFPRWPLEEIPVSYITNGVHMPTWDSPQADKLWTEACGKNRWLGTLESLEKDIMAISLSRIWDMRVKGKVEFIDFIRRRFARQLATLATTQFEIEQAEKIFDPSILTIGFARRFVSYKRPTLLLHDRQRLRQILLNKEMPVQLVIAGKAHNGDKVGQDFIREWFEFINKEGLQNRVVFLSDYDMLLSEHMVQGVDLWINTPKRPWEACGTSGMKVLVNGGLQLSTLDGWWDEAFQPGIGWAIGRRGHTSQSHQGNEQDAQEFYDLLEQEIVPMFYKRNDDGLPEEWMGMVRRSLAILCPRFSANRSLREYTENVYLKAAANRMARAANNGEQGTSIAHKIQEMERRWHYIKFGEMTIASGESFHCFTVEVYHPNILPAEIKVELYAAPGVGPAEIHPMSDEGNIPGRNDVTHYRVSVLSHRNASDYTPRVIPVLNGVNVPLECNLILWQR